MVLYPDMRRRRLSELSALLVPIVMLTAVMLWMTHEATLRVSVIMREESQARKVLFSADGVSIGSGGRNLNKMRSKNKDEVRRTTFVVRDWPAVTKKLSTLERRDREFGAIFEEHWQAQKNRSSDPYEANYFLIRHDGVKIGDHGHSLPLNDSFEFNCGGKKHMKLVVSHGFYWKKVAKVHGSHMYSLDKNPYVLLNLSGSGVPRCVGRLGDRSTWEIAHPPMVVSLTGSIWLDANGRAYSCETTGLVVAWELGAGCCTEDWTPLSDKTVVNVPDGHHLQFQSVFSLLQWHGSSPYHIIFEGDGNGNVVFDQVLPRLLSHYQFLKEHREIVVLVNGATTQKYVAGMLNETGERVVSIKGSALVKARNVIAPPPLLDLVEFYPRCTLNNFRHIAWANAPVQNSADTIVMLSRSPAELKKQSCHTDRCVHNFKELVDTVKRRFKGRYRVEVFPSVGMEFQRTVGLFRRAVALVGVHSGSFANMVFSVPGTAILHVGSAGNDTEVGPDWYRNFANVVGMRYYGLANTHRFNRSSPNVTIDIDLIINTLTFALSS